MLTGIDGDVERPLLPEASFRAPRLLPIVYGLDTVIRRTRQKPFQLTARPDRATMRCNIREP